MVTGSLYESDRSLYRFDLKSIFLNKNLEVGGNICLNKGEGGNKGWCTVCLVVLFEVDV